MIKLKLKDFVIFFGEKEKLHFFGMQLCVSFFQKKIFRKEMQSSPNKP